MNSIAIGTLTQLRVAFVFLTRLPIPPPASWPPDALARAVWVFPLVGIVIGGFNALVGVLAGLADLPAGAVALLMILTGTLLSGALHEDGLADTADGFGGGGTIEQKLTIMRDSRIGSYGALALLFSLGLRAAALTALVPEGSRVLVAALVAAHAGSRAVMPIVMWRLPLARKDGLAAAAGSPQAEPVLIGAMIGAAVIVACLGRLNGFYALVATAVIGVGVMAVARRQIGGYTGDVLGATQQIAEIAILLTAANGLGG